MSLNKYFEKQDISYIFSREESKIIVQDYEWIINQLANIEYQLSKQVDQLKTWSSIWDNKIDNFIVKEEYIIREKDILPEISEQYKQQQQKLFLEEQQLNQIFRSCFDRVTQEVRQKAEVCVRINQDKKKLYLTYIPSDKLSSTLYILQKNMESEKKQYSNKIQNFIDQKKAEADEILQQIKQLFANKTKELLQQQFIIIYTEEIIKKIKKWEIQIQNQNSIFLENENKLFGCFINQIYSILRTEKNYDVQIKDLLILRLNEKFYKMNEQIEKIKSIVQRIISGSKYFIKIIDSRIFQQKIQPNQQHSKDFNFQFMINEQDLEYSEQQNVVIKLKFVVDDFDDEDFKYKIKFNPRLFKILQYYYQENHKFLCLLVIKEYEKDNDKCHYNFVQKLENLKLRYQIFYKSVFDEKTNQYNKRIQDIYQKCKIEIVNLSKFLKINGNNDPQLTLYQIDIQGLKIIYIYGKDQLDIDLSDSDKNQTQDYQNIEEKEIVRSVISLNKDKKDYFILLILCESYRQKNLNFEQLYSQIKNNIQIEVQQQKSRNLLDQLRKIYDNNKEIIQFDFIYISENNKVQNKDPYKYWIQINKSNIEYQQPYQQKQNQYNYAWKEDYTLNVPQYLDQYLMDDLKKQQLPTNQYNFYVLVICEHISGMENNTIEQNFQKAQQYFQFLKQFKNINQMIQEQSQSRRDVVKQLNKSISIQIEEKQSQYLYEIQINTYVNVINRQKENICQNKQEFLLKNIYYQLIKMLYHENFKLIIIIYYENQYIHDLETTFQNVLISLNKFINKQYVQNYNLKIQDLYQKNKEEIMVLSKFLKIKGNNDPLIALYTIDIQGHKINYISCNGQLDIDLSDSDKNQIKDYQIIEEREIVRSVISLNKDKKDYFILLILCESYRLGNLKYEDLYYQIKKNIQMEVQQQKSRNLVDQLRKIYDNNKEIIQFDFIYISENNKVQNKDPYKYWIQINKSNIEYQQPYQQKQNQYKYAQKEDYTLNVPQYLDQYLMDDLKKQQLPTNQYNFYVLVICEHISGMENNTIEQNFQKAQQYFQFLKQFKNINQMIQEQSQSRRDVVKQLNKSISIQIEEKQSQYLYEIQINTYVNVINRQKENICQNKQEFLLKNIYYQLLKMLYPENFKLIIIIYYENQYIHDLETTFKNLVFLNSGISDQKQIQQALQNQGQPNSQQNSKVDESKIQEKYNDNNKDSEFHYE